MTHSFYHYFSKQWEATKIFSSENKNSSKKKKNISSITNNFLYNRFQKHTSYPKQFVRISETWTEINSMSKTYLHMQLCSAPSERNWWLSADCPPIWCWTIKCIGRIQHCCRDIVPSTSDPKVEFTVARESI